VTGTPQPRVGSSLDEAHHDGSELYRRPGPYAIGDTVTVRVRVPAASGSTRVRLRSVPDAEPRVVDAALVDHDEAATWWAAELLLHNPVTNYRFLLEGGELGYTWLTAGGLVAHDVTDDADFRVLAGGGSPAWLADTIGYQVFIDRFARSSDADERALPDWAIAAAWSDPVDDTPGRRTRQLYGGDLTGIEQRLDHLVDMGVTLLYLTPFFPARSAHRYDASSFDHVDPLLGGDHALASLIAAAHDRGIRVIGDITLNHTGVDHDWFRIARAHPERPERSFYMFDDPADRTDAADGVDGDVDGDVDGEVDDSSAPIDYVAWHDVPSLPKLDHRSPELARRLHDGPSSVVANYLRGHFGLDGWRVDCANTTGRYADIDENHRVARAARATVDDHAHDAWLVAEHCYDPRDDLDGTGWHGVMAYQWFSRPLWSWLATSHPTRLMSVLDLPHLDGVDTVAAMRHLAANVAWQARRASMTMLDSHDTARFRTVVGGDRRRHLCGLVALFTMPGVPTLCAGSEIGAEGDSMDAARVPFAWESLDDDIDFLDAVRRLVALRRSERALQSGGMRWLDATADTITYVRELPHESVLVHLDREGTGTGADRMWAQGAGDVLWSSSGTEIVRLTHDRTLGGVLGDATMQALTLPLGEMTG